MIRVFKVELNAAHPELPLMEATAIAGSPSVANIIGVPPSVGEWKIENVYVEVEYPDSRNATVQAVKTAQDVWTATLPKCDVSGRVKSGLRILADGTDETGAPVSGYVLGVADFAIYTAELSVNSGEESWTMHLFAAEPASPKNGDAFVNASDRLQIYKNGKWIFAENPVFFFSQRGGVCRRLANGNLTSATGLNSLAIGTQSGNKDCVASGDRSVSLGNGTVAAGFASTAIGMLSEAIGDFSVALGSACKATVDYEIVLGKCNKPAQDNNNAYNVAIFSVGIGTGIESADRKNALVIMSDGSVYINGIGGYMGGTGQGDVDYIEEDWSLQRVIRRIHSLLDSLSTAVGNAIPFANTGQTSIAVGNGNNINGKGSTAAFGAQQTIDCGYALAAGYGNALTNNANGSLAAGYKNRVDGKRNIVGGGATTTSAASPGGNNVVGENNIVAGRLNNVGGSNSLVVGEGNTSSENNAVVCGVYGADFTDLDFPAYFRVGYGVAGTPQTCFLITTDGRVFIDGVGGYDARQQGGIEGSSDLATALACIKSPLTGQTMPANPTSQELTEAVKTIWQTLGGTLA